MLIYPVSSFGFIVIVKINSPECQTSLVPLSKIKKRDFIIAVKKVINEIKHRYNFSFCNRKIKINCSSYCDLQIFVMKCTPFPEKLNTDTKRYFIRRSSAVIRAYREKLLVMFNDLDRLMDCIHALHHFILRKQNNFEHIKSGIYIKNETFLLLITKPVHELCDISKICGEYGKIIRYSYKLENEASRLKIENPLKALGKW